MPASLILHPLSVDLRWFLSSVQKVVTLQVQLWRSLSECLCWFVSGPVVTSLPQLWWSSSECLCREGTEERHVTRHPEAGTGLTRWNRRPGTFAGRFGTAPGGVVLALP